MTESASDVPLSGQIPYAVGQASVVRIPIPGTDRLCIEFRPRGRIPPKGTSSTLFLQDPTGKRHLRLDVGWNTKTGSYDYHWNQAGVHETFKIENHTAAGRFGPSLYRGAKWFSYLGRRLVVVGAGLDAISIVQASNRMKRATEVVAGWAGAWVGCKVAGAGGAAAGTAVAPGPGTAVGGVVGCIVGGIVGYEAGSAVARVVYDWPAGTTFTHLLATGP
ncbi:MAG TPA: hypothetical protein VHG91_06860 [Longimicrobium sp.]|nr:hypothetical protein [Longimicrobium sp.]